MTYAELLQNPKWRKLSDRIKDRDNNACRDCGKKAADGVRLDVHHCIYIKDYQPWEYPDDLYLTLCNEPCHPRRQKAEISARVEIAKLLAKWPIERIEEGVWFWMDEARKEAMYNEAF